MKKLCILIAALFALNSANAQWIWQNSTESFDDLYTCFFPKADTGYAFTTYSFVKTTNGGATWTYHTIFGLQHAINSIYFTDANTGYTVNQHGRICKTTNGGTTWEYQYSGTVQDLFSVYFPAKDTGYIVGDSGTILKTTTGGLQWTSQHSLAPWSLYSVCFVDVNTGYAAGGTYWYGNGGMVVKTTDGGNTWTSLPAGTSYAFVKLFFVNADTGFAIADSAYSSRILKTTDGGNTWTIKNMNIATDPFRSLYFANAATGYTVNGCIILKTTTGGDDWIIQYPGYSNADFYSIYFLNADTGYAVGYGGPYAYGAIIKTTNGGGYLVGVDDRRPAEGRLKIFPNPGPDKIVVETDEASLPGTLSVLDLSGRELLHETVRRSPAKIDISTLPRGIYVVKLNGETSVLVGKVVKE